MLMRCGPHAGSHTRFTAVALMSRNPPAMGSIYEGRDLVLI